MKQATKQIVVTSGNPIGPNPCDSEGTAAKTPITANAGATKHYGFFVEVF